MSLPIQATVEFGVLQSAQRLEAFPTYAQLSATCCGAPMLAEDSSHRLALHLELL